VCVQLNTCERVLHVISRVYYVWIGVVCVYVFLYWCDACISRVAIGVLLVGCCVFFFFFLSSSSSHTFVDYASFYLWFGIDCCRHFCNC
jgi:hypothetical protein